MATVTKPIALDESFNTTEQTSRNIADVLAEEIGNLVSVVSRIAPQTTYDLDDLGDVDITSPSNGQVLKYNGTSQKWENGNGGAGGGHTIEDRDGVDLTQRATLQFVDGLKATDDAVNDVTVVSDAPDEYTWAQWNNLTTAQQEAIPHALITDAPDVDAGVNADLLTKLWENPSPTSAFAAQNITLDSDDYDFLLIIHNSVAGQSYGNYSWIGKKCDTISCTYSAYAGTTLYVASRRLSTNGASCTYTDNAYTGNGASTTENLRNVPLAIYGIKKTLNLQFTAIASDVSTSADKCMLSDGVTSIEDAVEWKTIYPISFVPTALNADVYQDFSELIGANEIVVFVGQLQCHFYSVVDNPTYNTSTQAEIERNNSPYNFSTRVQWAMSNGRITITQLTKGSSAGYYGVERIIYR